MFEVVVFKVHRRFNEAVQPELLKALALTLEPAPVEPGYFYLSAHGLVFYSNLDCKIVDLSIHILK